MLEVNLLSRHVRPIFYYEWRPWTWTGIWIDTVYETVSCFENVKSSLVLRPASRLSSYFCLTLYTVDRKCAISNIETCMFCMYAESPRTETIDGQQSRKLLRCKLFQKENILKTLAVRVPLASIDRLLSIFISFSISYNAGTRQQYHLQGSYPLMETGHTTVGRYPVPDGHGQPFRPRGTLSGCP